MEDSDLTEEVAKLKDKHEEVFNCDGELKPMLGIPTKSSSKMDDKRSCDAGGGSEVHMRLNKNSTKQLSCHPRSRGHQRF